MAASLQRLYTWAIPLAAATALAQASIYDVKGGTRAVIFDRISGVREGVVNEGTHFLIPWLQKSIIYDVRTKPRNISTTTGSKDLQMVSLTLRVLHRPEVKMLPKIYQVWIPSGLILLYLVFVLFRFLRCLSFTTIMPRCSWREQLANGCSHLALTTTSECSRLSATKF
jgi:SPFH domain / Band 7 family